MPSDINKLPLKRVDIALSKFKDEAIPHHINLLQNIRVKIQKYQNQEKWDLVRKEQLNCTKIIKQIKQLLYELDTLRCQVRDEDLDEFDKITLPLRHTLQKLNKTYLEMSKPKPDILESIDSSTGNSTSIINEEGKLQMMEELENENDKVERQRAMLITTQQLGNDIQDINILFNQLNELAHDQAPSVNRVEENIENVTENVVEGQRQLLKAENYRRSTVMPITGAVIGCCLGGPIGLLAGLKIGTVAAFGGGILGFTAGLRKP